MRLCGGFAWTTTPLGRDGRPRLGPVFGWRDVSSGRLACLTICLRGQSRGWSSKILRHPPIEPDVERSRRLDQ
jgi:hypothetical protein